MSKMTFCISTLNNNNYLQLAIKSVRENSHFKDSPFIVYAENCTDGTNEWLEENKEKYNLEVYIETDNNPKRGIGGGMNFCASKVKTEFINFLQADIYVAEDWDLELLKLHEEYVGKDRGIVFSQRIQPDIFRDNPRAGTVFVPMDEFGEYYHNFDEKYFLEFCQEFRKLNKFTVRKGEGVSGLIRKEDWDYIGGNDDRFAPAYYEDMDLFIRMQNEGFKFMLTSESLIYHFASRASRFPDDDLTKRPQELSDVEHNSMKEFLGKYGRLPETDEHDFVKPIPITDGSPNRIIQEIK